MCCVAEYKVIFAGRLSETCQTEGIVEGLRLQSYYSTIPELDFEFFYNNFWLKNP